MIDFTELIERNLKGEQRNTGMLHCSTHLTMPIRHTQLYMSGQHEKGFDLQGSIRMHTGTMWHDNIDQWLKGEGHNVLSEVDLTNYLREGWTGRCDHLVWDMFLEKYVVVDVKTTKGEAIKWLDGKPKDDHIWQVSAYVHAANRMFPGQVALNQAYVYYLPMNPVPGDDVKPVMLGFEPFSVEDIDLRMGWVEQELDNYGMAQAKMGSVVTDGLADYPAPSQKLYKNKSQKCYDVKMVPHWTAQFCPYPEVCGCSEQTSYKIGHYMLNPERWCGNQDIIYVPRKGYEDIEPIVEPTERMMNSL